jgi:uncharacterized membrane protein YbhN (UPF0104 family)
VLARAGAPLPLRRLVPLAVAKLFLDQAVPIALSLLVIWFHHDLSNAILGLAAAVVVLAIGAPACALWLASRRAARRPAWLRRFPTLDDLLAGIAESASGLVHSPRLLALATGLQLGVFALDAATLEAMLWAIDRPVPAGATFASVVVATMAATIGPLPGGLGTFEAASVAMLVLFGVGVEGALAATLLLRGFTFWLPMLPGLWVVRRPAGMPDARPGGSDGPAR